MSKALDGDLIGAICEFDQVLRLNPDHAEAFYNRGLLQHRLGHAQAACRDYAEAIRVNPRKANAFLHRGLTRFELGDKFGAISDFNETLRLNPVCIDASYHRGLARCELSDKCGAIADFERVLQINPESAEAYSALGRVYSEIGNSQKADQCFQKAHQLRARHPAEAAQEAVAEPSNLPSKRRKQYINVMERLVSSEYEAQTATLSAHSLGQIDRTDVEAWALNRLPAHYATSRRWADATARQLLSTHRDQIAATIREGIVAVSRNWQPVEEALLPDEISRPC